MANFAKSSHKLLAALIEFVNCNDPYQILMNERVFFVNFHLGLDIFEMGFFFCLKWCAQGGPPLILSLDFSSCSSATWHPSSISLLLSSLPREQHLSLISSLSLFFAASYLPRGLTQTYTPTYTTTSTTAPPPSPTTSVDLFLSFFSMKHIGYPTLSSESDDFQVDFWPTPTTTWETKGKILTYSCWSSFWWVDRMLGWIIEVERSLGSSGLLPNRNRVTPNQNPQTQPSLLGHKIQTKALGHANAKPKPSA